MPVQIDTILDAARAHTDEVIKPNVDTWNEAGVWPRDASDEAATGSFLRSLSADTAMEDTVPPMRLSGLRR